MALVAPHYHQLGGGPKGSFQQMSPPRVELPAADGATASHRDGRYARLSAAISRFRLMAQRRRRSRHVITSIR